MSESQSTIGRIGWVDLTVAAAPRIRDFYQAVIGWEPSAVKMGEYDDFNMNVPGTGQPVAGICNARGVNADVPAQWLIYVPVADLPASIAACEKLGGKVLHRHPTGCIIQDPAGAVMVITDS